MHRPVGRRTFLKGLAAAGAGAVAAGAGEADVPRSERRIVTATGEIDPGGMGVTLPHEHVLVDFVGADNIRPGRYDADDVFRVMLPHLAKAREAGCATLFECTPAYLGRDPRLLVRLAKESGVRIVTNTGYYGAGGNKYLPAHAHGESADQLADRWVAEWERGIEGTGVRPGFMKVGVDAGPLSDLHRKLVRAAARAHRRTGLTIAVHTGDGRAALEQLAVLKEEGVSPGAWVWVHANAERDAKIHLQVAKAGGWVEFDGVGPQDQGRHVSLVTNLMREGLLGRVLISQDAGWYHVGEPGGGNVRPFDYLFTRFVPALKEAKFGDAEVKQLTVDNPREAFIVRPRTA